MNGQSGVLVQKLVEELTKKLGTGITVNHRFVKVLKSITWLTRETVTTPNRVRVLANGRHGQPVQQPAAPVPFPTEHSTTVTPTKARFVKIRE